MKGPREAGHGGTDRGEGSVRPMVLISGLGTGGAEQVTVDFLRRLARRGIAVPVGTVTARHDEGPARALERAGLPRMDLGARRLADPRALFRLRRLLGRRRISVLHAHGQDATVLGFLATRASRVAFAATRHVLEELAGSWRERLRARLTLAAFRWAEAPVAVSRAAADRLLKAGGLEEEAVRVIRNGVDLERFAPAGSGLDEENGPTVRSAVRSELGLPPDAPVVLVPAVLRRGKGHGLLLSAAPRLRARVPDVRILLAGGGEREAALRGEVARRELEGCVRFLGHRDDVPRLLAAADVVALPSRAEALPTVLLEAAAAGRPAVATRVGGTPEVVEDGRTGRLVPPGDPEALADALAELLSDPARARRMGRAARRWAEAHFDLDRQVRETLALWRELSRGSDRDHGSDR